jgi:hypothetical protein
VHGIPHNITMDYDATDRCCGWCYGLGADKWCAKCQRAYCSRECQIKDWKVGHHKAWCGKSGEKCIDYEVRDAGGKGLGLFTKRDFKRGDKILVERAVAIRTGDGGERPIDFRKILGNTNLMNATMALAPPGSTNLIEKFFANCVALGGDEEKAGSGLFLNFSRVNHDCVGNVTHYYIPDQQLKILVADCDILAGSEVSFSYASTVSSAIRAILIGLRGFQCSCTACQNPDIANKLDRSLELDKKIFELGSQGKTEQAIWAGESLIKLHNELNASDMEYSRVYYDLYQIAITRKKTVNLGMKYIQKAHTHALRFYGREEDEHVKKYKHFVEHPSAHRNYRLID